MYFCKWDVTKCTCWDSYWTSIKTAHCLQPLWIRLGAQKTIINILSALESHDHIFVPVIHLGYHTHVPLVQHFLNEQSDLQQWVQPKWRTHSAANTPTYNCRCDSRTLLLMTDDIRFVMLFLDALIVHCADFRLCPSYKQEKKSLVKKTF